MRSRPGLVVAMDRQSAMTNQSGITVTIYLHVSQLSALVLQAL